jgi:rhodanese-related sulfurtransferase
MFGRRKRTAAAPEVLLPEISPADAEEQVRARTLVLIDVRENDGRTTLAPGVQSQHLPVGEIDERMGELPTDRPLAFVCRSGKRSAKAAAAAAAADLDVRNVTGGMTAWQDAGLSTTKGSA